ncbi:hypothetical protein OHB53_09230 [Streptomyces sp. NBC_00056]|uniref:hypothetical protein n=1 Tax=Streptomyces sp. NBC_00056 TaxID=2975633 RepID=UPI0032519B18
MTTGLWARRRAAASCTATGIVIALLIAAIICVIAEPGVPSGWWPQTGNAFAASPSDRVTTPAQGAAHGKAPAPTPSKGSEVCDVIVGPAHDYCLRAPDPQSASGTFTRGVLWPLGVLAVGITALFVLHRRRRGL